MPLCPAHAVGALVMRRRNQRLAEERISAERMIYKMRRERMQGEQPGLWVGGRRPAGLGLCQCLWAPCRSFHMGRWDLLARHAKPQRWALGC